MTAITKFGERMFPSIFDELFDNNWVAPRHNTPAINVIENEKGFTVELAAPGMCKDDVKIHIDQDNNLVIAMEKEEKKEEKSEEKGRYLRREFSSQKFQQTIGLPENINKDKIAATVADGILSIDLPRYEKEEIAKATKVIEVK